MKKAMPKGNGKLGVSMRKVIFLLPVFIGACDRSGDDLIPSPSDVPALVELGELSVIPSDVWADVGQRVEAATYSQVGAPDEPMGESGVTLTFSGTGRGVCIFMDPEAVFWNQAVARRNPDEPYTWPDNFRDDGDLDLSAGLSSTYTGSPGIELGDFVGQYTDSLGNEVEIQYDECEGTGRNNQSPAHGGRAAPERCMIDTTGREGIEYTVVLRTFALPIDDSILDFAVGITEALVSSSNAYYCPDFDECSLPGESRADVPGDTNKDKFSELEAAFCANKMSAYCAANPEMCGVL
jgi:hypothetical protein